MTGRQFIGYGILIGVVASLVTAAILGLFNKLTEWTIPWEVWAFGPTFTLLLVLVGFLLIRDWKQAARIEKLDNLTSGTLDLVLKEAPEMIRNEIEGLRAEVDLLNERVSWLETGPPKPTTH